MDRLSILTCGGKLLAAKRWLADGTISEYDSAKYWTLATRTVRNITELSALLRELEAKPHTCLIRGRPLPPDTMAINDAAEFKTGKVRRSLDYFEDQPLHTILVDVDKFTPSTCDALEDPQAAIEEFITACLPEEFAGASYHWQMSNSAGHPSKGRELRAHLWFWLATPATSAQLTVWAEHVGYNGDVAVFRTVQPHYTAAPVLDAGQVDPFPKRSGFVEGIAGDAVVLALDPAVLQLPVRERSRGERLANLISDDPIALALNDQGLVRSQARDGALNIVCPFTDEHGTGEGAETSTQYFPPHTGGFAQGHFKCLHGTCGGRTREGFLERLGLDTSGVSPDDFDVEEQGEKPKPKAYEFVSLDAFVASAPLEWIIKGVLPKAQLGVVYGASGSGKSFMALDMAMAIAQGVEWRGRRVKPTRVGYIIAEGTAGFRKRVQAYSQRHNVDVAGVPVKALAASPNFRERRDVNRVIEGLKAFGDVGLVIVDTLAQVTPGMNENTSEDMGPVIKHCRAINEATGAMVLLVHHSGKDATKGARGHTSLRAALDTELEVARTPVGRVMRLTKSKDDIDGLEWGFDLEVVTVGIDEDGDEVTSCVVRETEVPKAMADGRKLKANEAKVHEAVQELAKNHHGALRVEDILGAAVDRMEVGEGPRDTRRQRAKVALTALCSGAHALFRDDGDGNVEIL